MMKPDKDRKEAEKLVNELSKHGYNVIQDVDGVVKSVLAYTVRIRADERKAAAERVEAEKVDAEETGTESDCAYNRGIEDAIRAILSNTELNDFRKGKEKQS